MKNASSSAYFLLLLFLAARFLTITPLAAADNGTGDWYLSTDPSQSSGATCTIARNEVTARITANKSLFYILGNHVLLIGDFEVVARIEMTPEGAQPGGNRRANLTLVSHEPGQSSLQQVYVGIFQKTVGKLVPTGGQYRMITNMVVGGVGGRFATRPASQEAPAGLFKIVRQGGMITTYYSENDVWIQFSQWSGGFPDKLQASFQVDNKWEAEVPCTATARLAYTPIKNSGKSTGQAGSSVEAIGKALTGLGKLIDATAATANNTNPALAESPANKTPVTGLDRAIEKLNQTTNALDGLLKTKAPAPNSPASQQPVATTNPPTGAATTAIPSPTANQAELPSSRTKEEPSAPIATAARPASSTTTTEANLPKAPTPAVAAAPLNLSDFDQDKWQRHGSAPWAPATTDGTPLPPSWSVASSAIAPVYDINHLTPGGYDGLVKTAMAGMRLVMGEITAEQDAAFESNWAPLLEYPCQEVLDYLTKFNPLCSQFLVAQEAFAETAKVYDRAQADLLLAASEEDGDSTYSASEVMRSTKNLMLAHSNTMTAVAKAIQDLGPLPNPLAHKRAARILHEEAMNIFSGDFAIEPAEITVAPGEKIDFSFIVPAGLKCDSVRFERLWYKPDEKVPQTYHQLGTFVVQAEPWNQLKPVPGVNAVAIIHVKPIRYFSDKLRDCQLGLLSYSIAALISERYEDGRGKRLNEEIAASHGSRAELGDEDRQVFIKWQEMDFFFEDRQQDSENSVLTTSVTGTISPDGTSIVSLRMNSRREFKTRAPDSMPGLEINSCEFSNIPLTTITNGGYAEFSLSPAEISAHLVAAQWTRQDFAWLVSPGDRHSDCRYRTETLKEIRREAGNQEGSFSLKLQLTAVKRQSNPRGAPWADIAANFKIGGAEDAEASLPPEIAALLTQARNEAAKKAKAEQNLVEKEKADRIKYHEANIRQFERLAASLRSELSATKGDVARENLFAQIMMAESSLQKEKDHIVMVQTGQWVNTRTPFDDYLPAQVAEAARDRAQIWGQASRTLELAHRQIALASPEDRARLLTQFNQSVALANGDPNKVVHAGKTLFDQVQGHYEERQGATEEDLINAEQKLKFAENVKTISDHSLMALGTIATAGGGGTLIYGRLTAEAALQTGYGVGCGYLQGGLPEAFKQAATSYSAAAGVFSIALDSYHAGVLENLRAHAEKPNEVAIDETGAGLKNVAWSLATEAAQAAAMRHIVEPAAATLRRSFQSGNTGVRMANVSGVNLPAKTASIKLPAPAAGKTQTVAGGVNWNESVQPGKKWPTVKERLNEGAFQAQQAEGRAKVNLFKSRCETAAAARRDGAPPAEVERLRGLAEDAYKAVKTDYHSKTTLKKVAELRTNPNLIRYYNFYDKKNMSLLLSDVNARLARQGIPPQHLEFISNSGSKSVGMDIDMHANDPARMLGVGKDRVPNPEYAKWRNQLEQTLADGSKVRLSPEEFRQKTQIILKESFERQFNRSADQVFPTFTTKDYAEAYKDKAWLGRRGQSHADFPCVDPLWTGQAADVTGFKVNSLPRDHPSLGTYTILQEQSRGVLKDLDTKVFGTKSDRSLFGNEAGSDIAIAPNGPLGTAPLRVQQHFKDLRRVLAEFSNNTIGPIEADRRLKELTGGRGITEVSDRLAVVLSQYKKS